MPSNMPNRLTPTVIGSALSAIAGVVVGAGVAAYIIGTLQVRGAINYSQNGTQTGAVLQVSGVNAIQRFPTTCTSTGGLTKYPTCIASSPYSTTGALFDVAVDCGNTKVAMLMSGSFVKTNSASSFGTQVLKNVTVGTGGLKNRLSQTGAEVTWNPADKLRLTTTTATLNSASNCTMWTTLRDKSGT